MAKTKRRGYGTTVEVDIAGSATFVPVGFSTALTPPSVEVQEVDGTTLDDDREVMEPGILTASEFTFKQFHDPNDAADQTGSELDDLAEAKTKRDWRITFPGGKVWTVEAWIKSIVPDEVTNKEFQTRTVTLKTTEKTTRS